jgi:hypothetical protein
MLKTIIIKSHLLFLGILIFLGNLISTFNFFIESIINLIAFVLILYSYMDIKLLSKNIQKELLTFNISIFNLILLYTISDKILEKFIDFSKFEITYILFSSFLFVSFNLLIILYIIKILSFNFLAKK